ncbi:MAG: ABC transporter substrate-binding protein, partial [Thermomicrobiales bacterium]|nr:ABC transporter substrate-binding protein [Thermomicrobiales bacterium]
MTGERHEVIRDRCIGCRPCGSTAPARPVSRRHLLAGTATGVAAALLGLGGARALAAPVPATGWTTATSRQTEPLTLTLALIGSPSDLDPHLSNDYRSALAIMGIYETLIALKEDQTDEYVGLLAESWASNDDQSVWTFTLRDGVTFQNGDPCDAAAVRLSFERYMTVGSGAGPEWTRFVPSIDAITAPDPRTVVFDLGRPQPLFEAVAAASYGPYVVNAALLREHEEGGDWGRAWAQIDAAGCGTGPYALAEFEPASLLRLTKSETWWGGPEAPAYTEVVMRVVPESATRRQLMEAGEIDLTDALTPEDFDALKANPEVEVLQAPNTRIDYLYLNPAGPLAAKEARQALSWAYPYQEVMDGIYQGYATQPYGFVAEMLRGFNPATFQYHTDLDKARELLTAAGVPDGTTLEYMLEPGDVLGKVAVQLFQANLAEIGVQLTINEVETSSYVGVLYGDATPEERPDIFVWAWWPSFNDAWSQLNALVGCGMDGSAGGANFTGYCNDAVQTLLDKAVVADNQTDYDAALAEVQQIITADDPPAIYYAQPLS